VVVVVLAAAGLAGAPRIAVWVVASRAREKGFGVVVENGRVAARGIRFGALRITKLNSALVQGTLTDVTIRWSSLWGMPEAEVDGGHFLLHGEPEELWRQLRPLGSNHETRSSASAKSFGLVVRDVTVEWSTAADSEIRCIARSIRLTHSENGYEFAAPELNCTHNGTSLHLTNVGFQFPGKTASVGNLRELARRPDATSAVASNPNQSPWILHIEAASLDSDISGIPLGAQAGGIIDLGGSRGARLRDWGSPVRMSEAKKAPKQTEAAEPKLAKQQPHSPRPNEIEPPRGEAASLLAILRDALVSRNGNDRVTARVPPGSSAVFDTIMLRLRAGDQKLDLGPLSASATQNGDSFELGIRARNNSSAATIAANLTMHPQLQRSEIFFAVGPSSLASVGIANGDLGLSSTEQTSVQGQARVLFDAANSKIGIESKGELSRLSIQQPWLTKDRVSGFGLNWDSLLNIDPATATLNINRLHVVVGTIGVNADGAITWLGGLNRLEGRIEIPLAACQSFFDAMPGGLAPLLENWRVDGTLRVGLVVDYDAHHSDKSKVGLRIDNRCHVGAVPVGVDPHRFEQPFTLDVEDASGVAQKVAFGPGTPSWTSLSDISPYVESAVLVCEDGRFLHHKGLDVEAIENSIRENLRAGRFARGGSTVSMQLAKNLYLRRDKTLSRKLQEAALTMLLEQTLTKSRLLELYLNVIEFGPGIYGIGPASRYYFATTPDRLTLAQAYYLISILPNPKSNHFGSNGKLTDGWNKLLISLMSLGAKRRHYTKEELDAGLSEQPTRGISGTPPNTRLRRINGDVGDDWSEPSLPMTDEAQE